MSATQSHRHSTPASATVRKLAKEFQDTVFIVDEAYFEFSPRDSCAALTSGTISIDQSTSLHESEKVVQANATDKRYWVTTEVANKPIKASIRRLQKQGALSILSRPKIIAANGQPATIRIGQSAPIFTSNKDDEEPQKVAGSMEVGISSTLCPRLIGEDQVDLQFRLEHSEPDGNNRIKSHTIDEDGKIHWIDAPR